MHLRLLDASFAYLPDVPVLEGVSLHLTRGWTALVGPNGAGKTTLLRLLAGELTPQRGVRDGPATAHVCPQRTDARTGSIDAFAWGWTGPDAWALQSRLALDPADLDRWPTLSCGERKRWQVGAALAARPEVLLLDEPTNHLDAEGRALLVAALRTFDGVGVLVSHDRALLRALATTTVRVAPGAVTLFPGGFDDAVAAWEQERDAQQRALDEASRQARVARRQLVEARRTGAAAERSRSASSRMRDPNDNDSRGLGAQFRADRAAGHLSGSVGRARRAAEDAASAREGLAVPESRGGALTFGWERPGRRVLLSLHAARIRAGDRVIAQDVDLTVSRDDRIRIAGPNGAGKSTLLRALLDAGDLPPDRVLYLPQELDPAEAVAVRDRVLALQADIRGRVLQCAAHLGLDPSRLRGVGVPSPGEARKLALAEALGRGVWLLALDEPTNHFDLPSVERLEDALRQWPGALLLVTHDADLATVADTVIGLGEALDDPGAGGADR